MSNLVAARESRPIVIGSPVIKYDSRHRVVRAAERERVLGRRDGEWPSLRVQARVGDKVDSKGGGQSANAHRIFGDPIVLQNLDYGDFYLRPSAAW